MALATTLPIPALALGALLSSGAPAATAVATAPPSPLAACKEQVRSGCEFHEFFFTRAVYSSYGRGFRGGWGAWATDFPKADQQFAVVMQRLAQHLDIGQTENPVRLDDPNLRHFPWIYAVEVGNMALREPEVRGLRDYLKAGGFLFVDDFWGTEEWYQFEQNIKRVLPEYQIVDLPMEHPLFKSYYNIEKVVQVPSINNARWGRTWERDGYVPYVKAIFDENQRLMVLISWNSDLGDAWEWAEQPDYPLEYSTYAFQVAVNAIIYAMSH